MTIYSTKSLKEIVVNQVFIGNKKLTKSIFNQIEILACFDSDLDFVGESILGYVKDKQEKYLLWTNNDKLRKTNLTPYYKLGLNLEDIVIEDIEWFLRSTLLEYDMDTGIYRNRAFTNLKDKNRYTSLVKKTKSFLSSLS